MSNHKPIVKADASQAGCWIDGHHGQYAVAVMIQIAAEHGRPQDDLDTFASQFNYDSTVLSDSEFEAMMDGAAGVEEWLNKEVAPEGFSFGWSDGEFFLWSMETWEEIG